MKKDNDERIEELKSEIVALKSLLRQTDYKALKHADGVLSDEEYLETKTERENWRKKINEYESELTKIKGGK